MPDFLLEIGLEEVPARMLASAQAELLKRTLALLAREQLVGGDPIAHSYSTPRRLAVLVRGVLTQQPDITEETTGPAVKIAFKDGLPTPAAEAFARKSGVAVSGLKTISTSKGDYLAAATLKRGRTAAEVLALELPKEIAAIYWAKNMYWRAGKPERFVRPVLWLACLLGDEIVPLTFAGKTAGRATYGHRVLSTGEPFEIVTPHSYLAQLEGEYVLADVEVRRQKIRKALDHVTRAIPNARWREDHALVDAVTHLTEWPDVLLGNFEATYLELPEEVLVTVMRDHQKYFAVEDSNGKLAPRFLTVTNIALDEISTPIIKQGNERVLRARFNDARFFWEFDQRTPLTNRVKLLESVTFQKDLGSYAQKSQRVRTLARQLGESVIHHGGQVDLAALDQAVLLAKTDLTTELVKEFTELQGIIGGLYARAQGFPELIADAIYDQYLPANSEDRIPRSVEGALLGIADRVDTLGELFRLGLEPTGSRDPFALRRAANAVVKILAESSLPLVFGSILQHMEDDETSRKRLRSFFTERIAFYLREVRGFSYDVVNAVLAIGSGHLPNAVARAEAVTSMRGSTDFLSVSAAVKRMKNILAQAEFVLSPDAHYVDEGEPVESALYAKFQAVDVEVGNAAGGHDFVSALAAIATLRPEVDAFFDGVMVNDPDPAIRLRRLTLLATILRRLSGIADFSEIVTAG
jgi:glycyl-tRNA synthetase beta chain